MKSKLMPTLVLTCICLVVAVMLAGINMITGPIIEKQASDAADATLAEVLKDGKDFEKLKTLPDAVKTLPVTDIWKAGNGAGYVFRTSTVGYKSGMIIMCGITMDGKIAGVDCIDSQETYGFENVLDSEQPYKGASADTLELIIATGASQKSLTSKGYYDGIDAALKAFTIVTGGSVDLRTPEEILQDNCNAALGTESVKFEKWLKLASLEGIDAVYAAENNAGYVFVIGEAFIAYNAVGDLVTADVSAENIVTADAAYSTVSAITTTKLDTIPDGVNKNIVKAIYSASNGAYVFELQNQGFEWASAPMVIKLAISADGKILDVITVSHVESAGYGDECATEEYYNKWIGKDKEGASSPDTGVISGATQTTNGYQQAIKAAFTAFEKLTAGGASND